MAAGAAVVPGLAQCALALLAASRAGTRLSGLTRLPLITVHLGFGAAAHAFGLIDRPVLGALAPAHAAALGVITIAAGSELALGDLRTHARLIRALAAGMTIAALAIVFGLTLLLLSQFPAIGGEPDARLHAVVASLAATIAVARSPSSAIAVVTELRAEGHFTQTLLGATMVTDVLAMVLFTAAAEIAEIVLAPAGADDGGPAAPGVLGWAAAFAFGTVYQLLLSTAHGVLVGSFALLALRAPRAAQPAALLAAAGVAFHGEAMARWLVGARADRADVEPMLACMIAGSLLSNAWRRRRPLDAVLRRLMPHVLLFFFTTTGADMDFSALAHAWPLALYLFGVRLLSIFVGVTAAAVAADAPAAAAGWCAYVTQAGVSLGLADEVASRFPGWGTSLRTTLVATVIINQVVGPPLLKHALRAAGEADRAPRQMEELLPRTVERPPLDSPLLESSLLDSPPLSPSLGAQLGDLGANLAASSDDPASASAIGAASAIAQRFAATARDGVSAPTRWWRGVMRSAARRAVASSRRSRSDGDPVGLVA